jgi:hypothetical protein
VRDYREVLRRIARATPEVRSHFFAAHAVLVSCYPWDIHPIVMHSAGSGDFLVTYAENVRFKASEHDD